MDLFLLYSFSCSVSANIIFDRWLVTPDREARRQGISSLVVFPWQVNTGYSILCPLTSRKQRQIDTIEEHAQDYYTFGEDLSSGGH